MMVIDMRLVDHHAHEGFEMVLRTYQGIKLKLAQNI